MSNLLGLPSKRSKMPGWRLKLETQSAPKGEVFLDRGEHTWGAHSGTCKLLKMNPVDYLTWVLPRLAAATNGQVDGLLPHHVAATLAAA